MITAQFCISISELYSMLFNLGCTVHAYDHTLKEEQEEAMKLYLHPNVQFHNFGIGDEQRKVERILRFQDMLELNGDLDKEITYLKV